MHKINRTAQASRSFITMGLMSAVLALSACGDEGKKSFLKGERVPVLTYEQNVEADASLADVQVSLPQPYTNTNWTHSNGVPTHAMHHLAIGDELKEVWSVDIGSGSNKYERLNAAPIIHDGTLYVMDIKANLSAFNAATGKKLWTVELRPDAKEKSNVAYGGGVVYADGRLFATTGYGYVFALNAQSGAIEWSENLDFPLRSVPTVADGRVIVLSQDNVLYALDAETGEYLWDHVGIVEDAGILGGASPAVAGDAIIAGFSSGELTAFKASNGMVLWQDALSRTGRLTALGTLSDIDGDPVVFRGRVYALNHAGRMVAIDIRSGERIWERNIGGIYTPWIAGDYIFVVTVNSEVIAMSAVDGRVKWVTPLQRFMKVSKRKGLIRWSGPVLAGDRLFVTSSHGYMLTVSPYTGEFLSGVKTKSGTIQPPIVANNTLYLLTGDGKLTAYR